MVVENNRRALTNLLLASVACFFFFVFSSRGEETRECLATNIETISVFFFHELLRVEKIGLEWMNRILFSRWLLFPLNYLNSLQYYRNGKLIPRNWNQRQKKEFSHRLTKSGFRIFYFLDIKLTELSHAYIFNALLSFIALWFSLFYA